VTAARPRPEVVAALRSVLPFLDFQHFSVSSHVGALIADATLQSGLRYSTVVRPRVERIRSMYPTADTISGLLEVLQLTPASDLLSWSDTAKPTRFLLIVDACSRAGIDDFQELSAWLVGADADQALGSIHGVGPKTVDYMRLLTGAPVFPIDRHLVRFLAVCGVRPRGYREAQLLFMDACAELGLDVRTTERALWRAMALGIPRHQVHPV
jgi:hypothetical protein